MEAAKKLFFSVKEIENLSWYCDFLVGWEKCIKKNEK